MHITQRLSVIAIAAAACIAPVSVASANGVTEQFAATGELAGPATECDDPASVFTIELTGGLEGCWYTAWFEVTVSTSSGVYQEVGAEWFVGCLVGDGEEIACGTFETTYRFTAKFTEAGQQHGRCQHPIVAGSGTGDFEGATGRVDFKDNVELGNFNVRGHIDLGG